MESSRLSPEELTVLCDKTFMPIKKRVSDHIIQLLGELREELKKETAAFSYYEEHNLKNTSGKITRGENYNTYAYRVLDYPSYFKGEDIFLYRTVMLWGHHFASYLISAGKWKTHYLPALSDKYTLLAENEFFIFDQGSPWKWEITPPSAIPISSISKEEFIRLMQQKEFIKIGRKLALAEYGSLKSFGVETWKMIME